MAFSAYANAKIMSVLTQGGFWLSLHSGDPAQTGANELANYARVNIGPILTSGSDGVRSNREDVLVDDLPDAKITFVGFWDSPKGGQFIDGGKMIAARVVSKGDALRFSAGKLTFAIN